MSAPVPGSVRFKEVASTPSVPPSGYARLYVKTDDVLYILDSGGVETALGSASSITSLVGEATGSGPGVTTVTLSNSAVIGKVLTGFVSGPNSTVLSTDTLLSAIQKLQAQATAGSSTAVTSLTGDVTGTGPGATATTVAYVGGETAADVATSVNDTQAATSANTSSTIVKRDASGNFSAGTITASLSGNATTATTATNFSGSLSGDVSGTQSTTSVDYVGSKTAAEVATSVSDTQAATSSNTSSTIVTRDASGNFSANIVTANLTGNVTGNLTGNVTGNVSGTALNVTGVVAIANGGTNSSTALSNNRVMKSSGGSIVEAAAITANRALISDSNGIPTHSITTDTELSYVNGVTSSIQGQINAITGSGITALTGDVSATGPGSVSATVNSVGGSSAANINSAELLANAATNLNTASTIVKRDASGDILVSNINGVAPEAHASRHLPAGADALTTAAPTTNLSPATTNSTGTANSLARSDHSHAINTSLVGDITTIQPDDTASAGTVDKYARGDHRHAIAAAAPTTTLDPTTSNAEGSGTAFARNDHTHAVATSLVGDIATIQPDDSASAGSVDKYARGDHKHAIATTAPTTTLDPTTTNAEGTATSFSRGDHTHAVATGLTADITTIQPDDNASAGSLDKYARADHKHAIVAATAITLTPNLTNAEGTSTSFARADHAHNVPSGSVVQIGTSNFDGAAASFALSDHVHSHGNQTNGSLHAAATTSVNGFMSSTDKTKLDNELPASLGTANQLLGVNAGATAGEYKTLTQTANQVLVTHGVGSITLSTPQDIHTGATPTFAGENLTDRLELTEQTAPTTPASNKLRIYTEDSNGFTRIRTIDDTGYINTILRDTVFMVKNTTGSTIAKGKAVYVNGASAADGVVTIALAKADSSTTVPVFGLTIESIANNGFGRVLSTGVITNIDTSAFSAGARVYLSASTAGGLTSTKPTSPNIWQRVGVVITSNASTGSIEVRPLSTHGEESGTNTAWTNNVVALTDGATINTDASLGNIFTVTLGGNRTLANPTNAVDGQKITFRIRQDGTGSRTLAYGTNFNFPPSLAGLSLSTSPNAFDYLGVQYNGVTSKYDVLAFTSGL